MASGNKARKVEQTNQAANQAAFNTVAAKQQETTPEQAAVNTQIGGILNNKGDWSDNPFINHHLSQAAALRNEMGQKNRGAYTMGERYANPNMLALAGEEEAAKAAQADAMSEEASVGQAQDWARNAGLQSAGLTANRYSSVLGPTAGLTENYNNQFADLSKRDFWADNFFGPMLRTVATGGIR